MPKIEILEQKGHRFLWIDDYLWMWDIPVERRAQKKIADQAYGDVLVAGYGLGAVQGYLLENKKVTSVLTIEKLGDLIEELKKRDGFVHGDVQIGDFYEYNSKRKFDCVIGDVWEDIEEEALEEYTKFKKKAEALVAPKGKVLAWGQGFFEALLKIRS